MAMTETPDLRTALERLRQVYDEVEFTDSDDPNFSQISRVDQGKLEDVIEALLVSHPPSPTPVNIGEEAELLRAELFEHPRKPSEQCELIEAFAAKLLMKRLTTPVKTDEGHRALLEKLRELLVGWRNETEGPGATSHEQHSKDAVSLCAYELEAILKEEAAALLTAPPAEEGPIVVCRLCDFETFDPARLERHKASHTTADKECVRCLWKAGNASELGKLLRSMSQWAEIDLSQHGPGPSDGYRGRAQKARRALELGLEVLQRLQELQVTAPGGVPPSQLLNDWRDQDLALQRIWGALGIDRVAGPTPSQIADAVESKLEGSTEDEQDTKTGLQGTTGPKSRGEGAPRREDSDG